MIERIARQIASKGGRAFFVGGWVRDRLLANNGSGHDIDIEVFYLSRENLISILSEYGAVKQIGSSYQVLKVKGLPNFDFVLPEPVDADIESACRRRDFTINSMLMDVLNGEIIDPLQGKADIKAKIIRLSDQRNFFDDPLRAYRAASLAARLNFTIETETFELMKICSFSEVSRERIFAELTKLLLLSARPSAGLIYLEKSGILARLHPRLQNLVGCPQSPDHHPEGDAWQHTLCVVDRAAMLKHQSKDPEAYMLSALLHDIGKPLVTEVHKQKITSYGHDTAGEELAGEFLKGLHCPRRRAQRIASLVREHMRPVLLYKTRDEVSDRAIRRLANRVDTEELLLLSEADYLGRDAKRDFEPIKLWLLERLQRVGLQPGEKVIPLVRGRDLIAKGCSPGPHFKDMLDYAFSLQISGLNREQILSEMDKKYAACFRRHNA